MANPDLELWKGVGCVILLSLPDFLPSKISSFFTQNKGGGGHGPPGSSPRSATAYNKSLSIAFSFCCESFELRPIELLKEVT